MSTKMRTSDLNQFKRQHAGQPQILNEFIFPGGDATSPLLQIAQHLVTDPSSHNVNAFDGLFQAILGIFDTGTSKPSEQMARQHIEPVLQQTAQTLLEVHKTFDAHRDGLAPGGAQQQFTADPYLARLAQSAARIEQHIWGDSHNSWLVNESLAPVREAIDLTRRLLLPTGLQDLSEAERAKRFPRLQETLVDQGLLVGLRALAGKVGIDVVPIPASANHDQVETLLLQIQGRARRNIMLAPVAYQARFIALIDQIGDLKKLSSNAQRLDWLLEQESSVPAP
jgi:hypothetical protein